MKIHIAIKRKPVKKEVGQIKKFFNKLKFEEVSHTYKVGDTPLTSVSNTIKQYEPPFDAEAAAKYKAKKLGMSPEAVLEMWEAKKNYACDKGHQVHLFGEKYAFDRTTPHTEIKEFLPYEHAVVKFWNDMPEHIVPAILELQMYSEYYGIAGTSDIILYDKKQKGFIIADYKTNEDLFKNYNRKLKGPFSHLISMPYNKYQLQLSYYQILFELAGHKVIDRRVIWLRPDGTYLMYRTDDYTEILKKELEHAKQTNNQSYTIGLLKGSSV